ncbi:uncharacterized protein LOC116770939 isoform X3 [Danaus plexippus]|uniref:uncharacterized protein LOC116770939 isoform X3 n=1 Tax=Danaus plexippus TaxID=13037 RepID=UPI002AB1AF27|nr:uncharacterized protein LOC116770939 isoform X3 [Danaus plexippus]
MVDWDLVLIALLAEDEERQIRTANLTKRQFWVHNLWRTRSTNGEFSNLFNDLRYDLRKFYDYYRMDYEKFEKLSYLLKSHIKKIKTNFRSPIPVTERLSVCLRYLITGASFKSLAFSYRMGFTTVRNIVHETCQAIFTVLRSTALPKPTSQQWQSIATDFDKFWNFPNCIGAIDDVGAYGRNSHGGILQSSKFGSKLRNGFLCIPPEKALPHSTQKLPHVFVADEAFPLTENIMRPYPSHLLNDEKKRIFNYRLSRARRIVENAFGMLQERFELFQKGIKVQPKYINNIILASTCLHNFIIDGHSMDALSSNTNNAIDRTNDSVFNNLDGMVVRDCFTEYFSNVGNVYWQNEIVNRC